MPYSDLFGFYFIVFYFLLLFLVSLFSKDCQTGCGARWEERLGELGGVGVGEIIIRIYCMKKILSIKLGEGSADCESKVGIAGHSETVGWRDLLLKTSKQMFSVGQ